MSPVASLLKSRKFLLLLLDSAVALVLFCVAQFAPEWKDFASQLIVILQPVFIAVILGIALEDSAAKFGAGK